MKKIQVISCRDCPYSENQFKQGRMKLLCRNPGTDLYEIHRPGQIEDWCELDEEEQ